MPRNISSFALGQAYRTSSNEVFLVALTIRHQPTNTLFRVVNNSENIVSRGEVFTAYPFELTLPVESGEEIGIAQLTIDNIDLTLIDMLRAATVPPRVDIEVLIASRPDIVEISLLDLGMKDVSWDKLAITARLYNEDILSAGYPAQIYEPLEWQGIFG